VLVVDKVLWKGLTFVLDQLATLADAELHDDAGKLRERLLEAQLALDLGEIDESRYLELERDVLARLRALRDEAKESEPRPPAAGPAPRAPRPARKARRGLR